MTTITEAPYTTITTVEEADALLYRKARAFAKTALRHGLLVEVSTWGDDTTKTGAHRPMVSVIARRDAPFPMDLESVSCGFSLSWHGREATYGLMASDITGRMRKLRSRKDAIWLMAHWGEMDADHRATRPDWHADRAA